MKKLYILLILVPLSFLLYSGTSVEKFVNSDLLKNANVSVLIKDVNSGEVIMDYKSGISLIPASTMKLVTTSTALELFGPDFRFKTSLGIDGDISKDSVLEGNLYIIGGGDPTLGSLRIGDPDFMNFWIAAIKAKGIKKITGSIIPDSGIFDNEGVSPFWSWEDIGNYYAAGAYGIACYDNTVRLLLKSGTVGTTPKIIKTVPEIPTLVYDNQLKSSNIAFDSAYFYGAPLSNNRIIRGEIPANKSEFIIKSDIPNPGLVLAQRLHDALISKGINVGQLPTEQLPKSRKVNLIYTYNSPKLSDIIKETNVSSNNLYAEHIFRYMGVGSKNPSTSVAAVDNIKNFWKARSIDSEQLFMKDGSGLSPSNAVSTRFFVDLLTYMYSKSKYKEEFYNSLPVSGVSGTLKNFLNKSSLEGKVHAKSGTISRVKCYAGYLEKGDKTYVFAIMVNNANGRSKQVVQAIEELLLSL